MNDLILRNLIFPGASVSHRRRAAPRHLASTALCLAGLLTSAPSVRAQTFSAATDWSSSTNPLGVWSYGSKSGLGQVLSLYGSNGPYLALSSWQTSSALPAVFKNQTNATVSYSAVYLPGEISAHPGSRGELSVFRFTAPANGMYAVQSHFYGLDTYGTTSDVTIEENNSSVLFSALVNGYRAGSDQYYASTLSLAAGDMLDFEVGYGNNNNYFFDTTGLQVDIQMTTAPEPASAVLIGSGLMAAFGLRRRARTHRLRRTPTRSVDYAYGLD